MIAVRGITTPAPTVAIPTEGTPARGIPAERMRLLLVEDVDADADLVIAHARLGALAAADVHRVARLADGLAVAAGGAVDCVLLDLGLPDTGGVDPVAAFVATVDVPLVVLTGDPDDRRAVAAVASGAQDYLVKGAVGPDLLARSVRYAIERHRAARERRALEERLQHAHRMETVGRLAGGIAHDFNNLLAVIGVATSVARDSVPAGHAALEQLDLVADTVHRAALLTRQLLVLARRDDPRPVVLSVATVVSELVPVLREVLGERVSLEIVVGDHVATVLADRAQLEHVVVNLVVNARDAMPDGGRLTIEVANRSGGRVALRVRDTGIGMPPEVAARAFEPFFTTKPVGSGTGLGLSTVYGIVAAAGGDVHLESAPDEGTTVDVTLPASFGDPLPATAEPAPVRTPADRTVLVVDDNEQIAQLVEILLRQQGHTVVRAPDGATALQLAADLPSLDLLVTDVVMAEMSGRELAEQLRRQRPGLAVVFISGYTADVFAHGELGAGEIFVRKPFTAEEILRVVADALS